MRAMAWSTCATVWSQKLASYCVKAGPFEAWEMRQVMVLQRGKAVATARLTASRCSANADHVEGIGTKQWACSAHKSCSHEEHSHKHLQG